MAAPRKHTASSGRTKVIEALNKARSMELYAIAQYMNQHYNLDDQDYGRLAAQVRRIAIAEMRHAEDFAERIKELGGEPTTTIHGAVEKGQDVHAVFPFNTNVEDDTVEKYNEFINICRENGDQVSANLFERIIDEEKDHREDFNDIAGHIKTLGDHYLASVAGGPAD